jgi:hypothetical protein
MARAIANAMSNIGGKALYLLQEKLVKCMLHRGCLRTYLRVRVHLQRGAESAPIHQTIQHELRLHRYHSICRLRSTAPEPRRDLG